MAGMFTIVRNLSLRWKSSGQSAGSRLCRKSSAGLFLGFCLFAASAGLALGGTGTASIGPDKGWPSAMLSARATISSNQSESKDKADAAKLAWLRLKEQFPVEWDWVQQDAPSDFPRWFLSDHDTTTERTLIQKVAADGGPQTSKALKELNVLAQAHTHAGDPRWLECYWRACVERRLLRLQRLLRESPRFVFMKHWTIRPSFFAYTEGQSDAQNERHFRPGAEVCLLELNGVSGTVKRLLADPAGAIRDPAVSWDGKRLLFAWKKSLNEDDYHLYEMELGTGKIRQITEGLGFADYEAAYLPNDDIIFSSTRCVQTVDCWWTEVSNLYTCDGNGRFLRRLGFDQVHAIYPQVLDDGRIIYTRWDYNDRGQIFPQPLFQMFPDGTGQTEFYGNNSWFPTTIAHARGIPGTESALAILCGHHSSQAGKLAVIDPAKGRQENSGVQLVAPIRTTPAERIDSYGQSGPLWQYPWPLGGGECVVGFAPMGWDRPANRQGDADFGIYWMDFDGRRELLAWDVEMPCSQPVAAVPRQKPNTWPGRVNYSQKQGTVYLQDIYTGGTLEGVKRGAVKKLRVVALSFRPAGIGNNISGGPAGGALISTPVAIGNGTWDVKVVLGDAKVHEDGSALFRVPARTPLYFQAIDERGCAIQTMRSWSTLQPGETASCVGCHEHKNAAPPASTYGPSLAMKAGPQDLDPFHGPARGFSFNKEVQPILDRHCVKCHKDRSPILELTKGAATAPLLLRPSAEDDSKKGEASESAFSLLSEPNLDRTALRDWSDAYLALTQARIGEQNAFQGDPDGRVVNWISSQSVPAPLPPYSAGAARSGLIKMLREGHKEVRLSREEIEKIACWIDLLVPYCGDYVEANAWSSEDMEKYQRFSDKRRRMEKLEEANIAELLAK